MVFSPSKFRRYGSLLSQSSPLRMFIISKSQQLDARVTPHTLKCRCSTTPSYRIGTGALVVSFECMRWDRPSFQLIIENKHYSRCRCPWNKFRLFQALKVMEENIFMIRWHDKSKIERDTREYLRHSLFEELGWDLWDVLEQLAHSPPKVLKETEANQRVEQ